MDTFSGYNQIQMILEDKKKMAFITNKDLYCHKVMPFDLKNTGTTYQQLINKVFKNQIDGNMEGYMNDMLVKRTEVDLHIADLEKAFKEIRQQ